MCIWEEWGKQDKSFARVGHELTTSVGITLCVINDQVIGPQVGHWPGHAHSREQGGRVGGTTGKALALASGQLRPCPSSASNELLDLEESLCFLSSQVSAICKNHRWLKDLQGPF